ncbi:uncharacterized protein LOC105431307 [Pogonomyrmex barbatus]|uniref:Uncharacterized protein LOC105431307 n=1 Tax=Pogonomyrmex barbatus TaxID=144034 RepID=A0A6I9WV33_9HYME|nr:uncharacterized protein LOC105431307 [Pogonomyrmex barbatus]
MGSRLRENVKQLFECFCEIAAPLGEKPAWILQKYPNCFSDEEILKSVPKFAYPCEFENLLVQHFSFVLTSIDSKWTFGFCRHDPKTKTALVVLSALPWHETFYKLLNHIASLTSNASGEDLWKFLESIYTCGVPVPGNSISIPLPNSTMNFICQSPKQFQLPSIPENRNLTEYYSAVDSHNMMIIFASMLYERRIIFISKRLSRLSACVQACNALIYPMIWQHIYIPVLPLSLIDYLLAPMPFLIGVPTPTLQVLHRKFIFESIYLCCSRKQYSPLSPSSPEESDSPLEHINIDLMHELRDVIFPNTPPVDRTLKPVRSLDSLRPAWSGHLRHGPLPSTVITNPRKVSSKQILCSSFSSSSRPSPPSNNPVNQSSVSSLLTTKSNGIVEIETSPLPVLPASYNQSAQPNQFLYKLDNNDFVKPINLSSCIHKKENATSEERSSNSKFNSKDMFANTDSIPNTWNNESYEKSFKTSNFLHEVNEDDPFDTSRIFSPTYLQQTTSLYQFTIPLTYPTQFYPLSRPFNTTSCSAQAKVNIIVHYLLYL